jgi:outer membrane protein
MKRTIVAALFALAAGGAWAQAAGHSYVAGEIANTYVSGAPIATGGALNVNTSNNGQIGFVAGYMVADHVAVEVDVTAPQNHTVRGIDATVGQSDLGEYRTFAPMLLVKYVFRDPAATFRPFVGVGVAYSSLSGSYNRDTSSGSNHWAATGTDAIESSHKVAAVAQVGLTINVTEHSFVGAACTYTPKGAGSHSTVRADLRVGYTF